MKICYDIRLFKLSHIFSIFLLLCLFPTSSVRAADLDSLRALIRTAQEEIERTESVITKLSIEFNLVNEKIYEYKADQNSGVNPLSGLRIRSALKTSHELADSLNAVNRNLRENKARLQHAYAEAIREIGIVIQHEMGLLKQDRRYKREPQNRLGVIKNLENEKADYTTRLQTMKVDEKGWEKIVIEPDDTLRRLKLKAALLEDYLTNLRQSLGTVEREIEKNRNNRKTFTELLDFYRELDESLDDDQDIFDRNRMEELRDKIENLDGKNANLKQRTTVLKRDITILLARRERFKAVITAKEVM